MNKGENAGARQQRDNLLQCWFSKVRGGETTAKGA